MTATFINSFILFFVTIDTIGNLPFFLSLTEGAKIKKRNQIALKSVIIAFFIMITFAYLGQIPVGGNSCVFRFTKNCRWSDSNGFSNRYTV